MSWGDAWGSAPRQNALRLAKAFYEGRELGGSRETRVAFGEGYGEDYVLSYVYKNERIAHYTPASGRARWVADQLEGSRKNLIEQELQFRLTAHDKGIVRHMKALGLDVEWQGEKYPILVNGAEFKRWLWYTKEQLAEWPKWEPPPKPAKKVYYPHREPFVNLTPRLFT